MNEKLSITFSHIMELEGKVKKIKNFLSKTQKSNIVDFDKRGIKYEKIGNYGVSIDLDDLSQEDIIWFKNRTNKLKEFIKELES